MFVGSVIESLDRGLFECSVHALDLAARPRVFGICQTMADVCFGASELESMSTEEYPLSKSALDLGGLVIVISIS